MTSEGAWVDSPGTLAEALKAVAGRKRRSF